MSRASSISPGGQHMSGLVVGEDGLSEAEIAALAEEEKRLNDENEKP